MTRVELILARHGETSANARQLLQGSLVNYPLNDLGRRQAAALADGMASEKIDWIVTSQLERAIETATCVAKYHPTVPFTKDARLNEISWGQMDGVDHATANPVLKPVVHQWNTGNHDAKIPGGESANECKERILDAFADILRTAKDKGYKRVMVVIHGRIMRVIMATLVDRNLDTMERFTHTNCCYHRISTDITDAVPDARTMQFTATSIDVRDHLKGVVNAKLAPVKDSLANL
ncbi:hypothetical protein GGI07_005136 [Coemansia sp. Benny D115]|nr:hypothetical protein GGI07_005136 [Coemansia sp. Benny D115]